MFRARHHVKAILLRLEARAFAVVITSINSALVRQTILVPRPAVLWEQL
jgi:hypothetical protein